MAKLLATRGPNAGQEFEIKDVAILGRSFDSDVRIDDLTVSRRHAKIERSDNAYFIEDLGSGNGTRVNGRPITRVQLEDNDEVAICQSLFVFRSQVEEAKPEAGTTTVTIVEREGPDQSAIINAIDVEKDLLAIGPEKGAAGEQIQKVHQRLRTVWEISTAIGATLDETELLNQILDRLFGVFPQVDRGFVILRDPESKKLITKASKRRDGGNIEEITFSRTIIQTVMNNKKAVLSSDAMGDDRFSGGVSIVNLQLRSVMCVPLIAQGDILGILQLDTVRQAQHFTNDDLNLLATIANQAALSIANARMHDRLLRRQRIEQDLQFAKRIQQSFLPQHVPDIPDLDIRDWYRSAQEVGGDFYDFIKLPDNRLGIVIGDVSGKGVPAALFMAKLTSDVRYFAMSYPDAASTVEHLNNQLVEGQAEDLFVTLLYMCLDISTKRLTIANAGHLPPLVRKGKTGTIERIEGAVNYPLGVLPEAGYEQEEYQLESGDAMAIFTDGIIEAMDKEKNQYGFERLEAAMARDFPDVASLGQGVLDDIRRFVGDTPQSDDLTLVCIAAS